MPEETAVVENETTETVESNEPTFESVWEDKPTEPITPEETTEEKPAAKEEPKEEPKEAITPEAFNEASKTAFNAEDGSFDSEKILGFMAGEENFYDNIKFEPVEASNEKELEKTPDVVYQDSVNSLVDDLPNLLKNDVDQGFTAEETLQRLQNSLSELASNRDTATEKMSERKKFENEIRSEYKNIDSKKLDNAIVEINNKLTSRYKDLMPGVSSEDVLNKFALDPKLGGKLLKTIYNLSNKTDDSLSKEDQQAARNDWTRKFQANGEGMRAIAEAGENAWIVPQVPRMMKGAYDEGYQAGLAQRNATGGKPRPNNVKENKSQFSPKMQEFMTR